MTANASASATLRAVSSLALAIMGCDPGEISGGAACGPTAESISRAVFAPSCSSAGCHGAVEPAAGLDLESAGVEARLLEQPAATCDRTLVVPGEPDESLLYEKVASAGPGCGDRMPIGAPLSAEALACIREWIASLPAGCETCGGGGCADLDVDPANCGSCGAACPTGASCDAGKCACSGDQIACGAACVDTSSDPTNCGACDQACGGMLVCSLGDCKPTCDGGLTKCGSACVDSQTDPNNCGDCGIACGATGTCEGGTCSCGAGIDTQIDQNNCGGCGNVCAPGQTCAAGQCTCADSSVSFSATVQPFLTASCATNGCHKGAMPQEGLDLTAGNSHAALVNVPAQQCNDGRMRVLPGDPSKSYVMDKLLGVDLCGGSKMPKMGGLETADVEAIANWICGGAEND